MTTTPPTAAEVDSFMNSDNPGDGRSNYLIMYNAQNFAQLSGSGDNVLWVVAYTDNGDNHHFEGIGIGQSGVAGASDTQLEESSPPVSNGGGPFFGNGEALIDGLDSSEISYLQVLPYIRWLQDSYGSITIRGYLLPAVLPSGPNPVDSTVQAWVNDVSNWPAAG